MVIFRRIIPELIVQRQAQAENSEFYILRSVGPAGFLIKDGETSFKVYLGEKHCCNCDDFKRYKDLCKHICWILLKKFKLSRNDPLSWQIGLVQRDLDALVNKKNETHPSNKNNEDRKFEDDSRDREGNLQISQRRIEFNDVCPICQDYFFSQNRSMVTFCRNGCGKSVHIKCIKIWMEHQHKNQLKTSTLSKLSCPMCRGDFAEVSELKREFGFERFENQRDGSKIEIYKEKNLITKSDFLNNNLPQSVSQQEMHIGFDCLSCKSSPIFGKLYQNIETKNFFCWKCFTEESLDSKNHFQCQDKANDKPYKVSACAGRIIGINPPELDSESKYPNLCQRSDFFTPQLREYVMRLSTSNSNLGAKYPSDQPGKQCKICLMHYKEGEIVIRLPFCHHIFHSQCIRPWLLHVSAKCPLDSVSVLQQPIIDRKETISTNFKLEIVGANSISTKQPICLNKSKKFLDTKNVTRLKPLSSLCQVSNGDDLQVLCIGITKPNTQSC